MSQVGENRNSDIIKVYQNEKEAKEKCQHDAVLDTVSFKSQGLSKLPGEIGNLCDSVKIVLEDNLFCELPSEICNLSNLKELNIANNKIEKLPDEIGRLINLEIFNAVDNKLKGLPRSFCLISNLKILIVAKNQICEIPYELKNLKKLTHIDLSFNEFTEVPVAITLGSHRISFLDLSHNEIEDFSREPKCSASLRVLKLSNISMKVLPNWIRCLQTIEELDLGNNTLTIESRKSLDEMVLLNASLMKKFSVPLCGLSHLPISIKYMKNLRSFNGGNVNPLYKPLSLSSNDVRDLSPLLEVVQLKELRLSYVSLPVLPDSFWTTLKCLEILDLKGNYLMWLPEGISKASNLIVCTMSQNRLTWLPADFGNIKSLKELSLDGNKLSELPESFRKLENLFYLDLYDNELHEFPHCVRQLHSLKYLDMEQNAFSYDGVSSPIPEDFFENYSLMKESLRSLNTVKQDRFDGMKGLPQEYEDNSSPNGSECSSPAEGQLHLQDALHHFSIAEEDWDNSDDSDSFFDPKYSRDVTNNKGMYHWARDNGRWVQPATGDVFCPADIHPDSMPSNKKVHCIDDGQFDDINM